MSINLSATTIKDYVSCPKKIYYKKISEQGDSSTVQMLRGSAVHKAIELYWNDYKKASQFVTSELKDQSESENKLAKRCINNYFSTFKQLLSPSDEVEKWFKYKIDNDTYMVGRIDRISGGVVIDWKTSLGYITEEELSYDPQFIIYYKAYKKLYNTKPKKVLYAALARNRMFEFKLNPSIERDFDKYTVPYVSNGIKKSYFPPLGLSAYRVCNDCPFVSICHKEYNLR